LDDSGKIETKEENISIPVDNYTDLLTFIDRSEDLIIKKKAFRLFS
jgi:hypothetical protein